MDTEYSASTDREAARIHTEVYLDKRYIDESDLNEEGLYVDAYSPRSTRILVESDEKETTMRIIRADKKEGGLLSLPTLSQFAINPVALRDAARVSRLSQINPKNVVELSGLASIRTEPGLSRLDMLQQFDATRQVYSLALRNSLDQGDTLWVMNVDDKMFSFLDKVLGEGSYEVIGDAQEYMGPATTPIAMRPYDIVENTLSSTSGGRYQEKNKQDLQRALEGVSEEHISLGMRNLLRNNGITTSNERPFKTGFNRIWRNKKASFYGGIIGYSALRFVGVGAVEEFEGSLPTFVAIDVGTAVTQVGSMELFFKGKNRAIRALGVIGTGASFAAPYAYFWANGQDYPPYVNAIAGGAVALGVGLETISSVGDSRIKKGLEESRLTPRI